MHLPGAKAAYQNALKQVRALKRVVVVPPEPPDYDWKCDAEGNAAADAAIDAYQKALFAKEHEALQQLFAAAKDLELMLGVELDPNEGIVARELIETAMYRKVDFLFGQYSGNPKKLMAVARIALEIWREDELLGGSGRPDWGQAIINWGMKVLDYYLDKLRKEHLYSKAGVVLQIARSLALLGANIDTEDLLDKIAKALTFKLTLDMNFMCKVWDSEGHMDAQVNEEAQGEWENLQASLSLPYPIAIKGIRLVSGSWADHLSDCSYALDPGQYITLYISLGLVPCGQAPQVIITLNAPEAGGETWTGSEETSVPTPWFVLVYQHAFVCQPAGMFLSPLKGGQAELVNETVAGDASSTPCADPLQSATGTIQFQLQHTPL
jgi:hypothetical protein